MGVLAWLKRRVTSKGGYSAGGGTAPASSTARRFPRHGESKSGGRADYRCGDHYLLVSQTVDGLAFETPNPATLVTEERPNNSEPSDWVRWEDA